MPLESLSCPNCGAPLQPPMAEAPWLCLYCNSLLEIPAESTDQHPILGASLDTEAMNSVKQLLISGRRPEAIQRFQQLSGLDPQQAQKAIDRMATDFSITTIFRQQLSPLGIIMVLISVIVLPATIVGWRLGYLVSWQALILGGLAVFELLVYGRGALTTLRYRDAPIAPALTLHATPIGAVQRGRLRVHTFLCVLDVHPVHEPPFQAQAVIPVRAENAPNVKPGAVIRVKYLPGQPDSLIYHQS